MERPQTKRPDLLPKDFDGKIWKIIEEQSELEKAIAKAKRFGFHAQDPKTGIRYNNALDILAEMDDVIAAIEALRPEIEALK